MSRLFADLEVTILYAYMMEADFGANETKLSVLPGNHADQIPKITWISVCFIDFDEDRRMI